MKREHVLPALGWVAGFYLLWLHHGTRRNPPDEPIPYEDFRTGLTFAEVRERLKQEQDAAYQRGEYMFVSRSTVLGRMHELKQKQYQRYLDTLAADDEADELVIAGSARREGDLF